MYMIIVREAVVLPLLLSDVLLPDFLYLHSVLAYVIAVWSCRK